MMMKTRLLQLALAACVLVPSTAVLAAPPQADVVAADFLSRHKAAVAAATSGGAGYGNGLQPSSAEIAQSSGDRCLSSSASIDRLPTWLEVRGRHLFMTELEFEDLVTGCVRAHRTEEVFWPALEPFITTKLNEWALPPAEISAYAAAALYRYPTAAVFGVRP